nr:classical arabinogalactan protein 9-like [Aegilops tauschii subsp. strangulata]
MRSPPPPALAPDPGAPPRPGTRPRPRCSPPTSALGPVPALAPDPDAPHIPPLILPIPTSDVVGPASSPVHPLQSLQVSLDHGTDADIHTDDAGTDGGGKTGGEGNGGEDTNWEG